MSEHDIQQTQTGQIKLPGNYFAKAKLEYNNWRMAWFREAIQNAMDAGAHNIDFTISHHEADEKLLKVTCADNGSGMDEDTLLNTFLSMGGSKKGENAVGGFGYAKVLLAFAHHSYRIVTQSLEVTGEAGDYSWKGLPEPQAGVRLEVNMSTEDCSDYGLRSELEDLVRHSSLPGIRITINGESIQPGNTENAYEKMTGLGLLTFRDNISAYSSNLWVRMKGLAMFPQSIYTNGGVAFEGYLDLDGHSLEVLTSNRDSLSREKGRALNQIMQALSNDREKLKLNGDIDLTLNQRDLDEAASHDDIREAIEARASREGMAPQELVDKLKSMTAESISEADMNPFRDLYQKVADIRDKLDQKLNKIPSQWYPENFKVKHSDSERTSENNAGHAAKIASSMNMKRNAKLAAGWSSIIKTLLSCDVYRYKLGVIEVEKGVFKFDDHLIQTGFVYGSPEGLNSVDKEAKRISIMINPTVVQDQDLSVGDIIDIAHHELTHLREGDHGEYFTMTESALRRIARKEIGEKQLTKDFSESIALWRDSFTAKQKKHESTMSFDR